MLFEVFPVHFGGFQQVFHVVFQCFLLFGAAVDLGLALFFFGDAFLFFQFGGGVLEFGQLVGGEEVFEGGGFFFGGVGLVALVAFVVKRVEGVGFGLLFVGGLAGAFAHFFHPFLEDSEPVEFVEDALFGVGGEEDLLDGLGGFGEQFEAAVGEVLEGHFFIFGLVRGDDAGDHRFDFGDGADGVEVFGVVTDDGVHFLDFIVAVAVLAGHVGLVLLCGAGGGVGVDEHRHRVGFLQGDAVAVAPSHHAVHAGDFEFVGGVDQGVGFADFDLRRVLRIGKREVVLALQHVEFLEALLGEGGAALVLEGFHFCFEFGF